MIQEDFCCGTFRSAQRRLFRTACTDDFGFVGTSGELQQARCERLALS
jgi:hypothetical protein